MAHASKLAAALCGLAVTALAPLTGQALEGFEPDPSAMAPLAARYMLLDAVYVDGVFVSVGGRGHVLTSTDGGDTWEQQSTPTRAMLTAVTFSDSQTGWAVGHDALVLKTTDGGTTWTPKYYAPDPEQPLFDVWFDSDGQRGIAVGAYGFLLTTSDGGETWEEGFMEAEVWAPETEADSDEAAAEDEEGEYDEWTDVEGGVHLYKIIQAEDGTLWISAEAGRVYRSDDGGETWLDMPTPYDGSFFGLLAGRDGRLFAFGLRGNLFVTEDRGETWTQLDTPEQVSLNDGAVLDDGRVVLVGMAGTVLLGSPEGRDFELLQQEDRKSIVQVLPQDGSLLLFGEAGAVKISVPAS